MMIYLMSLQPECEKHCISSLTVMTQSTIKAEMKFVVIFLIESTLV